MKKYAKFGYVAPLRFRGIGENPRGGGGGKTIPTPG